MYCDKNLELEHGSVKYQFGKLLSAIPYEYQAHHTCDDDYEMFGDPVQKCRAKMFRIKGNWAGVSPKCRGLYFICNDVFTSVQNY